VTATAPKDLVVKRDTPNRKHQTQNRGLSLLARLLTWRTNHPHGESPPQRQPTQYEEFASRRRSVTQDETAPVSESGYTSAVGRDQSSLGSSPPMIKSDFKESGSFRSKSGFIHDINCGRSFPVAGWRKMLLGFTGPTDPSVVTSLKSPDCSPEIYSSFDQRVRVSMYPSARSSKKSASFCIKPEGMAIHGPKKSWNNRDSGTDLGKEYSTPVVRNVPRIEVSDISNGQVLVTTHIKNFWVVPRRPAGCRKQVHFARSQEFLVWMPYASSWRWLTHCVCDSRGH
jgi:hypothetical protein